jgi:hypothetical protein
MFIYKEYYDLKKIKTKQFVAYTHLGLGDHIICNGLINKLSKNYELIHLPVKSRDFSNLEYMYSENPVIKLFKIEHESEVEDIKKYSTELELKVLKIGFKKRFPPFNLSFYKQLDLNYEISFNEFSLPENIEKENKLKNHLLKTYKIRDEYQVVHNQSSYGEVKLKINPELQSVYIDKKTDIFNNLFFYKKILGQAKEIHCLDSSVLHLAERIETSGNLFFHKIKKENQISAEVYLKKDWQEISY